MQDSKYIKDTMLSMTDHQLLTTTAGDHFATSFPTYSPINSDPQVSRDPVWTQRIPTATVKLSFELGRSYTPGEELEPLRDMESIIKDGQYQYIGHEIKPGQLPAFFGYGYMKLSNFLQQVPESWPRQIINNTYQVTQPYPNLIPAVEIDGGHTKGTVKDSYTGLLKTRYDTAPVEYMQPIPGVDLLDIYNDFYPTGITGDHGIKQPIQNTQIPHTRSMNFSGSIQSLNLECAQCELPTVGNCVYIGLELATTHRIDAYGTTPGNYYIATDRLPSTIVGQFSNHWSKVRIICRGCYSQSRILAEQFQYLEHMQNVATAVAKTERYQDTLGTYRNSSEWLERGKHGNGCYHMTNTNGHAKEIQSLTGYAPADIPCPVVWHLVANWTESVLSASLEQFAGKPITADALQDHIQESLWQTMDSQAGAPYAFDAVLYHASESRTNDAHLTARDYYLPTAELTRTNSEIELYGPTPKEIIRTLTETLGQVIARELVYDQLGHTLDLLRQSEPIKV